MLTCMCGMYGVDGSGGVSKWASRKNQKTIENGKSRNCTKYIEYVYGLS